MKFSINTEQFSRSVKPAIDIALKNTLREFKFEGRITLEAHPSTLHIKAYGGTASIIAKVRKKEGYIFEERGAMTVNALELGDSLKSFVPTEDLAVSTEESQLRLSLQSDPQICHELPASTEPIECPGKGRSFAKSIQVDRRVFVKGLKKVAYAMASEEMMHHYMCTLFESSKNKVRFTAGHGGRFALVEIETDGRSVASGDTKMIFPKDNIPNIIRILNDDSSDKITVKHVESNPEKKICEQIIITTSSVILALYGVEYFSKYPDLNAIINHSYSYQISTSVEDWQYITKAISATYHSHCESVHTTTIEADVPNGWLTVTPRAPMPVSRRVYFEPEACTANSLGRNGHRPWFCCCSEYLLEMVKKGYRDGIVTFNFEDQAKLDDMPDGKPKQMRPVLVEYPERTNKDGTREKYLVFFAVSTRS